MAQYWLQVPIENAKEMVQRYIDNSGILVNKTVTYKPDNEVVFYNLTSSNPTFNVDTIYFGTLFITDHQHETDLILQVKSGGGATINTLDATLTTMVAGKYEYIIYNSVEASPKDTNAYFVGYQFTLI